MRGGGAFRIAAIHLTKGLCRSAVKGGEGVTYRTSRAPKLIAGSGFLLLFVALFLSPLLKPLKSAWFWTVFEWCGANDYMQELHPQNKFLFDAYEREFAPRNAQGEKAMACTLRWAGPVIREVDEPWPDGRGEAPSETLRYLVSGTYLVRSQWRTTFDHVRYTRRDDGRR